MIMKVILVVMNATYAVVKIKPGKNLGLTGLGAGHYVGSQ